MTFSKNSVAPEIILSFMSGAVTGLDVSSAYNLFASSAGNCKLRKVSILDTNPFFNLAIRVNHIVSQDLLSQRIFSADVTSLKWLPSVVSEPKRMLS